MPPIPFVPPGHPLETAQGWQEHGSSLMREMLADPVGGPLLRRARGAGADDALARFGVKEADMRSWGQAALRSAVGQPGRAFVEGPAALRPGGLLHWRNVLWPSKPGGGADWLARAGTMAMPLALPSMMRQHPEEGRLSNTLGSLGGLAGMAYGGMAGGMLGMPFGGALGAGAGHLVGHVLGSRRQEGT